MILCGGLGNETRFPKSSTTVMPSASAKPGRSRPDRTRTLIIRARHEMGLRIVGDRMSAHPNIGFINPRQSLILESLFRGAVKRNSPVLEKYHSLAVKGRKIQVMHGAQYGCSRTILAPQQIENADLRGHIEI